MVDDKIRVFLDEQDDKFKDFKDELKDEVILICEYARIPDYKNSYVRI